MGLFAWIGRLFGRRTAGQPPLGDIGIGRSPFAPGTGPSRLIVFRHAEKSGDANDPHLSLIGRRRAEQLVTDVPKMFGTPQFLVAARTSGKSRRPVETLEPLAAALGLEVRAKYADGDAASLVAHLAEKKRYRGAMGLISWRHSDLPRLVRALGAPPDLAGAQWASDDYTTVIDLVYPGDGSAQARRLTLPALEKTVLAG